MDRGTVYPVPAARKAVAAIGLALALHAAPAPGALSAAAARKESASVLFWSQAERDANFRHMERLFPEHVVRASRHPRPLPRGRPIEPALGGRDGVARLMAPLHIAGLLVLQDGRIRLEHYADGYSARGHWTSFSVAKSVTSTLVGAAVRDGLIGSIDDPITRYIPELAGSGYDGVTIAQVLTMTSGVRWNEDYTDPNSDVVRMFADPPPPGMDPTIAYLRRLPREAPPGSKWVYKTGETSLIGVLVRRATGRSLADYLSEKIWRPYGMEADALWQIDERGQEAGGYGLSVALRDYGRIGQFMLDGGIAGGRAVLPDGWIAAATAVRVPLGGGAGYGFQWWTSGDGTYGARGIYGQLIHINPARRLVIVTSSAWPKATEDHLAALRTRLIAAVTAAVDRDGGRVAASGNPPHGSRQADYSH